MLAIFRRYQKYIYAVVTVIIIISFSFFGTYSAMQRGEISDPVVFTAVDGTSVTRSQLEEMVLFLSSDNEDKILFGGAWGPNFLNDGVIKKDILQTGIADALNEQYGEKIRADLEQRSSREKHFKPYAHPQAEFITAKAVWDYIAPDVAANFQTLKEAKDPSSQEAFAARVHLYLAQRKLPAPALRQILKYQEKQYPWVTADPALDRTDLSLFGYHLMDDWFGPGFMRLTAQFVINGAIIAEQKGYHVSYDEALAEMLRNSQLSYEQNIRNPNLGVASNEEYIREQLRRMGMDQKRAVRIWQKILLFRRLLQDAGNSALVDPLSYREFAEYADAYVSGEVYQLPEALRIGNFSELKKLQLYIQAVAKGKPGPLEVPDAFKSLEEVKKETPALVQRQYKLQIREVDKKNLQTRVGVKETWEWEVQDDNWETLKKEFPELGIAQADTRSARFAALDQLSPKTRGRVDAFARKAIVEAHPEWIENALEQAKPKEVTVGLGRRGGKMPISGIKDRAEFLKLLENAAVGKEPEGNLAKFSPDQEHYYRIQVLDRAEKEEILTFAQAKQQGILDEMLEVSTESFNEVLAAIRKAKDSSNLIPDAAAAYRFYPYMEKAREELIRQPEAKAEWVGAEDNLKDQWKLVANETRVSRNTAKGEMEELLAMKEGEWSPLFTPPNGNINFFHIMEKGAVTDLDSIDEEVMAIHEMLAHDAKETLGRNLLQTMKEKNAISLKVYERREEE